MKSALKIGSIVLIIVIISVPAWNRYRQGPPPVQPSSHSVNPFVQKTKINIDSLSNYSESTFCNVLYKDIKADIRSYRLDSKIDSSEELLLLKNLDYTYFDKFTVQAFRFFGGSKWDDGKVRFIATETAKLKHSPYLEPGSVVSEKFNEIQAVINTYNEVSAFIENMKAFFDNGTFNLYNSKSYINSAANWEQNGLNNRYVNNITEFHNILRSAPSRAYSKHLNYLRSRVNANIGEYRTGTFSGNNWAQKATDYRDKVFDPIAEEIEQFQNISASLYGISPSSDLQNIKTSWNSEIMNAIEYFKKSDNLVHP